MPATYSTTTVSFSVEVEAVNMLLTWLMTQPSTHIVIYIEFESGGRSSDAAAYLASDSIIYKYSDTYLVLEWR